MSGKHAFLLLAHEHPEQLGRLIQVLQTPNSHVFIHVDKKSKKEMLQFLESDCAISQFRVNWGGFNMVLATLALLKIAKKHDEYQTYTLLSGADYPIKPISEVLKQLDSVNSSRIDFWHDEDISWYRRYKRRYFNDTEGFWGRLLNGVFRRLTLFLPERRFYKDLIVYFGSQWWTLDSRGVDVVLDFVKREPEFLNYCRHVHIPDEMFFQTVLVNELGEQALLRKPMRYLDWSEQAASPKTLREEDWRALQASEAIFARKFDPKVSKTLMDKLDRRAEVAHCVR